MAPRRSRIVTVRMVATSLALGLLLAVLSVPLSAAVLNHQARFVPQTGTNWPTFALAEYFKQDGHVVLVLRQEFLTGTTWESSVSPESSTLTLHRVAGTLNAKLVQRDARPKAIRAPLDGRDHTRYAISVGWPFEAAVGTRGWSMGGPAVQRSGLASIRLFGHWWSVPYRPLWLGLLGNTLFYAAIAFAILVWWRVHRIRRRTSAGCCFDCGYELGDGVTICPECGLAQEG